MQRLDEVDGGGEARQAGGKVEVERHLARRQLVDVSLDPEAGGEGDQHVAGTETDVRLLQLRGELGSVLGEQQALGLEEERLAVDEDAVEVEDDRFDRRPGLGHGHVPLAWFRVVPRDRSGQWAARHGAGAPAATPGLTLWSDLGVIGVDRRVTGSGGGTAGRRRRRSLR